MCVATRRTSFGFGLTDVNEVRKRILFILDDIIFLLPMVIQYTLCLVELLYPAIFPYPIIFPYPVNVQEFLHDLILSLTYPVKFTLPVIFPYSIEFPHPVIFTYPIKALIRKYSYLLERNNNQLYK